MAKRMDAKAAKPDGKPKAKRAKTVAKKKAKKRGRPKKVVEPLWTLAICPVDAPPRETWRPEWRDKATSLLAAYNEALLGNPARASCSKRGLWVVKASTVGTLDACYAVHIFARSRSVDSLGWVRWVGRRVRSGLTPSQRLAQLFDLDLLKAYLADDLASLNAGRAANAALNAILGSSGFVVGRDLHHGAELAKANFRQRRHEILCIEAHDITRGFHPRSDICGGCPLRDRCKAETAFRVAKERP